MIYSDFVKKYALFSALLIAGSLEASTIGIIGGTDFVNGLAYSALVSFPDQAPLSLEVPSGNIKSVAINELGQALIVGEAIPPPGPAYATLVSPARQVSSLSLGIASGVINSVSINSSSEGLIGGKNGTVGYAAFVSPAGLVSSLSISADTIDSVSINKVSEGLIGGTNSNTGYAAYISPAGLVTPLTLGLSTSSAINSVSINKASEGLIGGNNGAVGYAAYISHAGNVSSLPLGISNGVVLSVSLNSSSQGLIGGQDAALNAAYAALVTPAGQVNRLALGFNGVIRSVSINSTSEGLIGGFDIITNVPYAAFISPTGQVTSLNIETSIGQINSVSINEFGQGLIGGYNNGGYAYAALVLPTGQVTPLKLGFGGFMSSVAMILFPQMPTTALHGNNLDFASYINQYAPQDVFYFIPAIYDGTLSQALESAAPTRNAFSLFTADNNVFFLDSLLSNHSQNVRQARRKSERSAFPQVSLLFASNEEELIKPVVPEVMQERPLQIWGTVLGALTYQKAQHQTPAFQPTTGAAIIGFDGKITTQSWLGCGAAYAYTHIHEKKGAGHANINQEYLFLSSLWNDGHFYFDAALWGGLFQIENVRKIQMTGFEFTSKSHPKGLQVSPHVETGYGFNSRSGWLTTEPFVMFDWVSNWQRHYREKGSGPFNVAQKKLYSSFLRSETGVRVYETVQFENWSLVCQEKISYVNKKPFDVGRVNAFIVGSAGSFTVETLMNTQNLGVAELEFLFQPKNPKYPYASIQYQGEFGSMYQSHTVSVDLTWDF
jgi:hypothetical protein